MRSVASLAVLLLILVVSFDFMSWSQEVETERVEAIAKQRPHRIRAFSSGWNFPPVKQGTTNQFEGALVDDRWCRAGKSGGLRVITIPPGDGEVLVDNFHLLETDTAFTRFEKLVATAEINTTFILSAKQNLGRILPRERREAPEDFTERKKKAGFLLRGMGVRTNPEDKRHVSFVYICVRRPQGFVRLAEKISETRGVEAALHLDADVSVYDDHVSHAVVDNRWLVTLKDELAQGERIVPESGRRFLKEVGYASLRTTLAEGQEASIAWDLDEVCAATIKPGTKDTPFPRENLEEGGNVTFSTKLAWRFTPEEEPAGLQFILRVNGQRMGDRLVLNSLAETERWILWEEVLAKDIGPLERVEVQVLRIGEGGPLATVHLAETTLSAGELYSF